MSFVSKTHFIFGSGVVIYSIADILAPVARIGYRIYAPGKGMRGGIWLNGAIHEKFGNTCALLFSPQTSSGAPENRQGRERTPGNDDVQHALSRIGKLPNVFLNSQR